MSLKSQKIATRYLLPFGNGTQKPEGEGASDPLPPAKNRVNGPVASVISSRLPNFSKLGPIIPGCKEGSARVPTSVSHCRPIVIGEAIRTTRGRLTLLDTSLLAALHA